MSVPDSFGLSRIKRAQPNLKKRLFHENSAPDHKIKMSPLTYKGYSELICLTFDDKLLHLMYFISKYALSKSIISQIKDKIK